MKPKISTGYLTPQAKKKSNAVRNRLSDTEETEGTNSEFNEGLFQALMKCPEKKKLVLQLLASNKDAIDKYRNKADRASPVAKLKATKKTCESPTALLRRRALEQMNNNSPSASNKSGSRPNSRCSSTSSYHSSPVPFEKILEGVIVYVEIRSRQDEDRSAGAKEVLRSMGAQVRDTFTNDVTHVVFKDGSYTTFRRAKLMKVHLVSILWLEFSRKTMQRQNEKQYPAMGSGFEDETIICSQMQKEYEDIIRDEYRRSIVNGTPLPTTKTFINRRRTLMTPSVSNSTSFENICRETSDFEVATINGFPNRENTEIEKLIINDPECFSQGSAAVVKDKHRSPFKSRENLDSSDMELTSIPSPYLISRINISQNQNIHCSSDMELTKIPEPTQKIINDPKEFIQNKTPRNSSQNLSTSVFGRRKTICNPLKSANSSMIFSDKSTNISDDRSSRSSIGNSSKLASNTSLISSDKSTNISDDSSFAIPKATPKQCKKISQRSSRNLSTSNDSFVFGKNTAKRKGSLNLDLDKTASAMSELKLSTEISNNSIRKSTSMSALQISLDSKKNDVSSELKSISKTSHMSSLRVSSGGQVLDKKEGSTDCLMSCLEISDSKTSNEKSGSIDRCAENLDNNIKALQTPEFITVRKRSGAPRGSTSCKSDESEILSPRKNIKISKRIILKSSASSDGNSSSDDVGMEITQDSHGKQNILDSSNNVKKASTEIHKSLVVNVIRSPIKALDKRKTNTRRKTLGMKPTKQVNTSSASRGRRKTLGPQEIEENKDNKSPKFKPQNTNNNKSGQISVSNESGNSVSSDSDSSKVKRKARKLYNPDDSIPIEVDDEKEREEKRNQIRKRKSNDHINPLELLKANNKTNETTSESDTNDITSPKRSRKGAKKIDKRVSLNSSADEQKELLNEVLNKKTTKSPEKMETKINPAETPSRRKSTRITKPTYKILNAKSDNKLHIPITPMNRRSTMEFMSLSEITSSKKKLKKKLDRTKLATIVCTKLHKADVQLFAQVVKKLGRFIVEDEVTDRTTHLVAGEPKRTINMLRAASRGCWIIKYDWVLQSLEQGKWLPEEDFEVTDFSPVVQKCRLERQAFGTKYRMDVFASCPSIYVAASTSPRCSDLKELIATCKGKIVSAPRMAKIVVGQYLEQEDTVCVNETWILDCITFYKLLPFKEKYRLVSKRLSLVV